MGEPKTADPLQLEIVDREEASEALRARAVTAYNALAGPPEWVGCIRLDPGRGKALDAILKARGLEAWTALIIRASKLAFFDCRKPRGGAHNAWRPSIDFFLKRANLTKIEEGNYDQYRNGSDAEPLRNQHGGARIAAIGLFGSVDRQGGKP